MDITVDGTHVRSEGGGDMVGEIALLRSETRTATVTVQSETIRFWRLSRRNWDTVSYVVCSLVS